MGDPPPHLDPEDDLGEAVDETLPKSQDGFLQLVPQSEWQEGQLGKGLSLIYPDFYLISCSPRRSGSCELIARSHYAVCIANGL